MSAEPEKTPAGSSRSFGGPLRLWSPVVLWCALIFFLSSVPDLNSGFAFDYPLRKAAHMLEYGILFGLTRRALLGSFGASRNRAWAAAAFCVFYAMTDEYHQTLVPGRAGRWSDVGIDSVGVCLAAAASFFGRSDLS